MFANGSFAVAVVKNQVMVVQGKIFLHVPPRWCSSILQLLALTPNARNILMSIHTPPLVRVCSSPPMSRALVSPLPTFSLSSLPWRTTDCWRRACSSFPTKRFRSIQSSRLATRSATKTSGAPGCLSPPFLIRFAFVLALDRCPLFHHVFPLDMITYTCIDNRSRLSQL